MPQRTMEVTRTYLELDPNYPVEPPSLPDGARLDRVVECPVSFYRYLYGEVGRPHRWTDRLGWSDERLRHHLTSGAVTIWVLYVGGTPAGFFELQREPDQSVQIAYFGLLPEFIGRGLGGVLLEAAIVEARRLGSPRIWLHTCTLDHPAALANYLNHGFRPVREERYTVDVPQQPLLYREPSDVYRMLRDAIVHRRQVIATYRGVRREMCPHVLGLKAGREQCLFYQFGGESAGERLRGGGVDNWRCLAVDELRDVEVRDGQWYTAEIGSRRQTCVDSVDLAVQP
jgi:GNAT superfamily N-acetyltransferase